MRTKAKQSTYPLRCYGIIRNKVIFCIWQNCNRKDILFLTTHLCVTAFDLWNEDDFKWFLSGVLKAWADKCTLLWLCNIIAHHYSVWYHSSNCACTVCRQLIQPQDWEKTSMCLNKMIVFLFLSTVCLSPCSKDLFINITFHPFFVNKAYKMFNKDENAYSR